MPKLKTPTNGNTATAGVASTIIIPKLNVVEMQVRLVGTSPLLCHAWSAKAKKQMLDKQMKKAVGAKEAKDPFADYVESLYWLTEKPEKPTMADVKKAKFGFPAIAFKAAAVDACIAVSGIAKTEARASFHVKGEYVEIDGPIPEIDQRPVRIGMGTADLRYRGRFDEWAVTFYVEYNANLLSAEQIINLFNTAGFSVGVGDWRPQKDGMFGRFEVE